MAVLVYLVRNNDPNLAGGAAQRLVKVTSELGDKLIAKGDALPFDRELRGRLEGLKKSGKAAAAAEGASDTDAATEEAPPKRRGRPPKARGEGDTANGDDDSGEGK